MSFIKNEDDTQSSVSIDLSAEDCAEDESLLEANSLQHQQAYQQHHQQQSTPENLYAHHGHHQETPYGHERQATTDQQFQTPLEDVFYTKPSLNLLDGKFFQYIPEKSTNNKLVAYCMKCYPLPVEVKGYGSCTSNFISHLKRRHGDAMVEEYRAYMKSKKRRVNFNLTSNPRKIFQEQDHQMMPEYANASSPMAPSMTSMPKLMRGTPPEKPLIVPIVPTLKYTPTHFGENAANFFISAMIPPKEIENPYFKKMLLELNVPEQSLQTITCQNLEQRIKQRYQEHVASAMTAISALEFYAVSLHLWSCADSTSMLVGLVVHWLEQDLCRKSMALAVRQIELLNLNDQTVEAILIEFGVYTGKIQAMVVGKGKNYVQEYKELGVDLSNIVRKEELELENCIFCDEDDIPSELGLINENTLPAQLTCPAHLLNKALSAAFVQVLAASNDTALSKIHAAVMKHCNMLWKAKSGNFAVKLKCPVFDNWGRLVSALEQIAALNDKSQHLYDALRPTEISYLHEFLTCTAPIMEALKILQTEECAYFGIVLPCLFALKRNLKKVGKTQNLLYCQTLLDSYLKIVSNYFEEYFQLKSQNARNAAIAALSYPRFKNQWFVCVEPNQRTEILNIFKRAVSEHIVVKPTVKNEPASHADMTSAFFDFGDDLLEDTAAKNIKSPSQISLDNSVEAQVLQFFAEESTDITILNQYPEIKKVFMQYNTPLASLAIGENLFSSSVLNTLKRNQLDFNPLMEKRLILNAHLDSNQY